MNNEKDELKECIAREFEEIAKEEVFDKYDMPNTSYGWMEQFDTMAVASFNREGENRGVRRFPRQKRPPYPGQEARNLMRPPPRTWQPAGASPPSTCPARRRRGCS